MIEFTELSKNVINTVAPFLVVGGEEIVKGVSSELWSKIKSVFSKKGEQKLLEQFEVTPNDVSTKAKIEYILENELKNNNDLALSLAELIKNVQATDDYRNYVTQTGDNNIAVSGKISNSSINIHK